MSKKFPDISDSGGQIRRIVDIEQFEAMAKMLKIDPEKVPGFLNQIKHEIHEFLTERERREIKKDANDLARHFWSRSKVVKSHRGDLNHAKETI